MLTSLEQFAPVHAASHAQAPLLVQIPFSWQSISLVHWAPPELGTALTTATSPA